MLEMIREIHTASRGLYGSPRIHAALVQRGLRVYPMGAQLPAIRPDTLEDVAFYPVTQLAELLRTRQVSAVELAEMYIERLRHYDPLLQCVVTLTGYVGSTPVLKEAGEQRVASFSLAVNRKTSSGKQQTLWVRVNCWNGFSDVAMKYLHKGSLCQCEATWMRSSA